MKGYCYGADVAIKVLRGEQSTRARQLMEGFKEEVKIMSEVTHPNVCVAGSTLISLATGLAVPVESWPRHFRLRARESSNSGSSASTSIPVWSVSTPGSAGTTDLASIGPLSAQAWCRQPQRRQCVEVSLADSSSIVCTPDHRLLQGNGHTWTEAGSLLPGTHTVSRSLLVGVPDVGDDQLTGPTRLVLQAYGRAGALALARTMRPAAAATAAKSRPDLVSADAHLLADRLAAVASLLPSLPHPSAKVFGATAVYREYAATLAAVSGLESTTVERDAEWWRHQPLITLGRSDSAAALATVLDACFQVRCEVRAGVSLYLQSAADAAAFVSRVGFRYRDDLTCAANLWLSHHRSSFTGPLTTYARLVRHCPGATTIAVPVVAVAPSDDGAAIDVYDVSVPNPLGQEHASFVADGIVAHNCLFLGACFADEVMLVTELLEGDLIHLLNSPEGRRYSLFKRAMLARDVAMGLAWLHHINIVHLDLKPANVLYDSHGRLKVADFGLARIKSEDGYIPGACGGTPLYSAPEVLRKEDFTDKADVYSFGLIVWFILTGIQPYGQFTDWNTFYRAVVIDEVRPELPKSVPPLLGKIISSCWAQDPSDRPSLLRVLPALEIVLLETGVADDIGRALWRRFFFSGTNYGKTFVNKLYTEVFWKDFMTSIVALLRLDKGVQVEGQPMILSNRSLGLTPSRRELTTATREALSDYAATSEAAAKRVLAEERRRTITMGLECARVLLVNKEGLVSIERFGFVLDLFGPLDLLLKDSVSHVSGDSTTRSDDGEERSDDDGARGTEGGEYDERPTPRDDESSTNSDSLSVLQSAEVAAGETLLRCMAKLMSQSWFHGELGAAEAYILLKDKRAGTFLVRFSEGQRSFVLSAVLPKSMREKLLLRAPTVTSLSMSMKVPMFSHTGLANEGVSSGRGPPQLKREASDPVLMTPRVLPTDDPNRRGPAHALRTFSGAGELSKSRRSSMTQSLLALADLEQDLDVVVHMNIMRSDRGRYYWPSAPHLHFASVTDLIEASERLTRPCSAPKTRFGYLFTPTRAVHYGYLSATEHRNPFEPSSMKVSSSRSRRGRHSHGGSAIGGIAPGSGASGGATTTTTTTTITTTTTTPASSSAPTAGAAVESPSIHLSEAPAVDVDAAGEEGGDLSESGRHLTVGRSNLHSVVESPRPGRIERHSSERRAEKVSDSSHVASMSMSPPGGQYAIDAADRLRRTSDPFGDEAADQLAEARAARRRRSSAATVAVRKRGSSGETGATEGTIDGSGSLSSPRHHSRRTVSMSPRSESESGARSQFAEGSSSRKGSSSAMPIGSISNPGSHIGTTLSTTPEADSLLLSSSARVKSRRNFMRRAASLESETMGGHIRETEARRRGYSTSRANPSGVIFSPPRERSGRRSSPRVVQSYSPRHPDSRPGSATSWKSPEPSPRLRRTTVKRISSDDDDGLGISSRLKKDVVTSFRKTKRGVLRAGKERD
jgi:serine/threonine protein kinase